MVTEDGTIVSWRHLRTNVGAVTACIRYKKGENLLDVGFSFCSPDEKNFRKDKGRKKSYKRLMKNPVKLIRNGGIVQTIVEHLKGILSGSGFICSESEPWKVIVHLPGALTQKLGISEYAPGQGCSKQGEFLTWFQRFVDALEISPREE